MAAEAETEDFVNPADPDAFAGLLESNPDVDFIAEIPEDAARVVLQPDGRCVFSPWPCPCTWLPNVARGTQRGGHVVSAHCRARQIRMEMG